MGNAGATASAAAGPGGAAVQSLADVARLYAAQAERTERVDHWEVSPGSRKRDGAPVTLFKHVKTGGVNDEMASNALRMARRMRHPLLLTFLDGAESDQEVVIVTEAVTPLATWLRANPKPTAGAVEWGLRCLTSALVFLNEEAQLVHGNVQTSSVFVTRGGDWKFAGMEVFGEVKGEPSQLLRQAQWIPDAYFKSPERRANDWASMSRSPPWSLDVFGLACIWSDVFAGVSASRSDANTVNSQLPSALRDVSRQMLVSAPEQRPRPSAIMKNEYFSHIFVRSSVFMEELQLKPAEKREPFFKSLAEKAPNFPKDALVHKFAPLLVQAVAFETREVNTHNAQAAASQGALPPKANALVPMLEAILTIDACTRQAGDTASSTVFEPAIVDLFSCNDRLVRITLLQRMDRIASMLSTETLNGPLFDSAITGFSDATPMVRELTIKAIVPLIGKLNDVNKNDKLMRCFAKLQSDEQAAIRTNTIVCLGLIASHLSADTRRKVLPASFARSMKDPFVHARVAGIRGLTQTHRLLQLDALTLATKIMPSVCPLLADPAKEVRAVALDCMQALLQTLAEQQESSGAEEKGGVAAGAQSGQAPPLQQQDSGLLMRGLGWAADSITSRIASTPAPAEPTPKSAAVAAPVVVAAAPKPLASWEEDDDNDEDDFLSETKPSSTLRAYSAKHPSLSVKSAATSGRSKDILSGLEDDDWGGGASPSSSTLAHAVDSRAPSRAPVVYSGTKPAMAPHAKAPSPRASAPAQTPASTLSAPPPTPALQSSSSTAADDFFDSLLTAPPKKALSASAAGSGGGGPPPRVRRQQVKNTG